MGMSDKISEGTWLYNSTGSTMSYTNWNSGEPNGGTNENCIIMVASNGVWVDVSCNGAYSTMCEKVVQINPKGEIIFRNLALTLGLIIVVNLVRADKYNRI